MKIGSGLKMCLGLALMLGLSAVFTLAQTAVAPAIVGDWEGTLDPGAKPKQRVVVHITADQDGTLAGTIDYPDQNSSGTLITAITFKEHIVHFECSSNLSIYDGKMSDDKSAIAGSLKQSGGNLSLNLKRTP